MCRIPSNRLPPAEDKQLIFPVNSTGGIIALGLGVKEWRVNNVIDKFIKLCDKAFTPREFHRIPGFRYLTTINHGSKYKNRPFEKVLREHFKEECLFGGQHKEDRYSMKVAVTSTSDTGQQATVLSNYNRHQPEKNGRKSRNNLLVNLANIL